MSSVKERKKILVTLDRWMWYLYYARRQNRRGGERNENELENGDYKEYSRLSVCRTHQHKTGKH